MKIIIKILIVIFITSVSTGQNQRNIHLSCTLPDDQLNLIVKTPITQPIATKIEFEKLIQTVHQDDFHHLILKLVSIDSINQPDKQDTVLFQDGSCLKAKFNNDQLEYLVYILPKGKFGWDEQALLAKIINPFIHENLNSNFDFYKLSNDLEIFDEKNNNYNFKRVHDFRTFKSLFLLNKKNRKLSIMIYK